MAATAGGSGRSGVAEAGVEESAREEEAEEALDLAARDFLEVERPRVGAGGSGVEELAAAALTLPDMVAKLLMSVKKRFPERKMKIL